MVRGHIEAWFVAMSRCRLRTCQDVVSDHGKAWSYRGVVCGHVMQGVVYGHVNAWFVITSRRGLWSYRGVVCGHVKS